MRRIVLLTGFLLAGCTGDMLIAPLRAIKSPSDFSISATGGTTPVISWDGEAASLEIVELDPSTGQRPTWSMSQADARTGFSAPVAWGVMPANATCAWYDAMCPSAQALLAGHRYAIVVTLTDGQRGVKDYQP